MSSTHHRLPRILSGLAIIVLGLGLEACAVDNSFDPVPPGGHTEIYGDLRLETQLQVDKFKGIKVIEGDLEISGREITDLSGLVDLRRITGQLSLNHCPEISDLAPLGNLRELGRLRIRSCHRIASLEPLNDARGLTDLYLYDCDSLVTILSGSCLSALESCNLQDLPLLTSLELLTHPVNLQRLVLEDLPAGLDYAPLERLSTLTGLQMQEVPIAELPDLANNIFLDDIELRIMDELTSLAGVSGLPYLERIYLWQCPRLTTFADVENLPELSVFTASDCDSLVSLAFGADVGDGGSLRATECPSLTDLSGLTTSWGTVDIRNCRNFSSLAGLTLDHGGLQLALNSLPGLRSLDAIPTGMAFGRFSAGSCANLESVDGLTVASLGRLELFYLPALTDLAGLVVPPDPHTVNLSGIPVTDLDELAPVVQVTAIALNELEAPTLAGLENLRAIGSRISVQRNTKLTDAGGLAGVDSVGHDNMDYYFFEYGVTFLGNTLLDSCALDQLVAGWDVTGEVEISGNGPCAD